MAAFVSKNSWKLSYFTKITKMLTMIEETLLNQDPNPSESLMSKQFLFLKSYHLT